MGFWGLSTTDESVRTGQTNFWAIAETLLANVAFWFAAVYWETFAPLYTALAIAPMLLMRSRKSVSISIYWFNNGFIKFNPFIDTASYYYAFELQIFWRIFYAVLIPLEICIIIVFIDSTLYAALFYLFVAAPVIAATSCLVVMKSFFGEVVFDSLVSDLTRLDNLWWVRTRSVRFILTTLSSYMFVAAIISIFVVSTMIRIISVLRFFRHGYESMPNNVKRLATQINPMHMPELLPGLGSRNNGYSIGSIIKGIDYRNLKENRSSAILFSIFLVGMILLWYIPAWLYRIVLKSTLWLWWVLIFVGGGPETHSTVRGLRADAYLKFGSWVYISVALFAAFAFIINYAMRPLVENIYSVAPLPGAVILLFELENFKISLFQGLSLLTSILTLLVVKNVNDLWVDNEYTEKDGDKTTNRLYNLNVIIKIKTAVSYVWISLLIIYIFLFSNAIHNWFPLSAWAKEQLEVTYGASARALDSAHHQGRR